MFLIQRSQLNRIFLISIPSSVLFVIFINYLSLGETLDAPQGSGVVAILVGLRLIGTSSRNSQQLCAPHLRSQQPVVNSFD
jgi:hypothetical protein